MSHSIKKNFAYNLVLTLSGYIFAFIIFPYVARVLGVEKVGAVNFVDSIINYFVLFSMLGVSAVGIREVAKHKDNQIELENSFRDIFLLNLFFTIFTFIVLIILIFTVPDFNRYSNLFYIGLIKLLFNFCLVEWFFTGSENFKYITIRSTIIKAIYVVSVLVFVREKEDYNIYYFLTCTVIAVNAIFNWTYILKIIKLRVKGFNYKRYIRSISIFGFYMILTSMYVNFNVAYLGFVSGQAEVGYYTTATKLYSILLSIFSAFTGVMLPRMTSLILENKYDEFAENIQTSFSLLILFSFPLIIFTVIFARQIILLLAGPGYEGSVIPMQIVMPLLIVIGLEQILVLQVLMPLKKDKIIMWNSFFGALLGIVLNIILVHYFRSIGSAIVWLCCEFFILILSLHYAKKSIELNFPYLELLKQILFAIPIILFSVFIKHKFENLPGLIIGVTAIYIYYIVIGIWFLKNKILVRLYNTIISKF